VTFGVFNRRLHLILELAQNVNESKQMVNFLTVEREGNVPSLRHG
jgi:hypothetical protein